MQTFPFPFYAPLFVAAQRDARVLDPPLGGPLSCYKKRDIERVGEYLKSSSSGDEKMDSQEMRMFGAVCMSLEKKFRRLGETGEVGVPFCPLEVAEALAVAAKEFRPNLSVVQSK